MSHKITKINKIPLQSLLGYGLNDQYESHTVLYTGSFISVVFWRDIDLSVLLYGMLMEWIRPHFVILESWIECRSFMYTGVLKIGSDLLEIGAWKELLKIDSILLSWEVGLNAVVLCTGNWRMDLTFWNVKHGSLLIQVLSKGYIYMPEDSMQDIKKWMEMKLFCSGCRALWRRTDPGRRVPQHRKLLGVHSVYEGKPNQDQLSEESKEITFWLANEKLCRRSNMHLAVMRQNWECFEVENHWDIWTLSEFEHCT